MPRITRSLGRRHRRARPSGPSSPVAPQRVLVTGAASGIGLAFAQWYAAAGAQVLATDLPQTVDPGVLPDGVTYRRLDVTSDDDWAAAREWVAQEWGGLDVVVNNAGVAAGGRIDRLTMAEWEWILNINLLGVVRGCATFAPMMIAAGSGRVINVASVAGLAHAASMASYNVSKAGVVALSETLLHELGPHGIAVHVVCPFFVRTNLAQSLRGGDAEAEAAAYARIASSPRTPEVVVRRAMRAVEAGKFVVLTDAMGRVARWGKQWAPPVYHRVMVSMGRQGSTGSRG